MPARGRLDLPSVVPPQGLGPKPGTLRLLSGGADAATTFLPITEPKSIELPNQIPGLGATGEAMSELEKEFRQSGQGKLASDYTPEELNKVTTRWNTLFTNVPNLTSTTGFNYAISDIPMEEAIRLARNSVKAENKSWWSEAWDSTGGALLNGMEWIYQKTTVDLFQEIGEATGLPSKYAQKMSPGQIVALTVSSQLRPDPDGYRQSVIDKMDEDEDGNWHFSVEDDFALGWSSGALDITSRIFLDPLVVAGKFRAIRALPLGLEKAFGIERQVAGGIAPRVQRINKLVEEHGFEEGARRVESIIDTSKRTSTVKNWIFGDVTTRELATSIVGHHRVRRFVDDMADISTHETPTRATVQALLTYGKLGFGRQAESRHFAYMVERVRELEHETGKLLTALPKHQRSARSQEALTELITGTVHPETVKRLQGYIDNLENAQAHMRNAQVGAIEAHQAAQNIEQLIDVKSGQPLPRRTPIRMNVMGDLLEDLPRRERRQIERMLRRELENVVVSPRPTDPAPSSQGMPITTERPDVDHVPDEAVADDIWHRMAVNPNYQDAPPPTGPPGELLSQRRSIGNGEELVTYSLYDEAGEVQAWVEMAGSLSGEIKPFVFISVRPDSRRQGLARRLIEEAGQREGIDPDALRQIAAMQEYTFQGTALRNALFQEPLSRQVADNLGNLDFRPPDLPSPAAAAATRNTYVRNNLDFSGSRTRPDAYAPHDELIEVLRTAPPEMRQRFATDTGRLLDSMYGSTNRDELVTIFVTRPSGSTMFAVGRLTPEGAIGDLGNTVPKIYRVPRANVIAVTDDFATNPEVIINTFGQELVPIENLRAAEPPPPVAQDMGEYLRSGTQGAHPFPPDEVLHSEDAAWDGVGTPPATFPDEEAEYVERFLSDPRAAEKIHFENLSEAGQARVREVEQQVQRGRESANIRYRRGREQQHRTRIGQNIRAADWHEEAAQNFEEWSKVWIEMLRPHLKARGFSDDQILEPALWLESMRNDLAVLSPIGEFPAQKLLGHRIPWASAGALARVPILRAFDVGYMPHRVLQMDDPFWYVQMKRLGTMLNRTDEEVLDISTRMLESRHPGQTATMVKDFLKDSYQKIGFDEPSINRLIEEAGKREANIYGVIKGQPQNAPFLANQEHNFVALTDARLYRGLKRISRVQGTALEAPMHLYNGVINGLDAVNMMFKRLMIMMPKSGLRVVLEGQARAASMGLQSFYSNPLNMGPLAMAIFSPNKALKTMRGRNAVGELINFQRKEIRYVALNMGDIGMGQMGHHLGYLTKDEWQRLQEVEWVKIRTPGQKNAYRADQAKWINERLKHDDLVNFLLLRANPQEMLDDGVRFILSPEGHMWRRKTSFTSDWGVGGGVDKLELDARAHVQKILDHLDDYGMFKQKHGTTLGQLMYRKEIYPEDIAEFGAEAKVIMRSEHWVQHTGKEAVQRFFDTAVERNLAKIEFIGRDHTTRAELYRATWAEVARRKALGSTIDETAIRNLLEGAVRPDRLTETNLIKNVKTQTFQRLKTLFMDMSEQSRISELTRFAFPFGNAYQEIMSVWGRIFMERPWVPHLGYALWNAADDVPGVTYRDPGTGEKMYKVPLLGSLMQGLGVETPGDLLTGMPGGVALNIVGRLDSFNMVSSGFPIPGPFLQAPAAALLRMKPSASEILNMFFPFGTKPFVDSLQPGWWQSAKALLDSAGNREETNVDLLNITGTLLVEELAALRKRAAGAKTPEEAQAIFATIEQLDQDQVIDKARWILGVRLISRLFAPSPVTERSPFRDHIEFYRHMQNVDPSLADEAYVARFGPEILAILQERTRVAKDGTIPPTTEARRLYSEDPAFAEFVENFGQVGWNVVRTLTSEEYDPVLFREQIANGARVRLPIGELLHQADSSIAWQYYFDAMDKIEQRMMSRGIANINSKAAKDFRIMKQNVEHQLRLAFPQWATESNESKGGGSQVEDIVKLATIAGMDAFKDTQIGAGLREYFELRARTIAQLRREGVSTLDSQEALHVKIAYSLKVREIVGRYPHFASLWGRYLQRDRMEPLLTRIEDRERKPGLVELSQRITPEGEWRTSRAGRLR